MRPRPVLLLGVLALFGLALPAATSADHVTATPEVSARLGEAHTDTSWTVIVEWSINCNLPAEDTTPATST